MIIDPRATFLEGTDRHLFFFKFNHRLVPKIEVYIHLKYFYRVIFSQIMIFFAKIAQLLLLELTKA